MAHINGVQLLGIPSLVQKSSSIRGIPLHNFTFGSQPSNSFAFVMSGEDHPGCSPLEDIITYKELIEVREGIKTCNSTD
nr:hypothetical protein Itr_chr02CG24140 [Ipomoea trifida]